MTRTSGERPVAGETDHRRHRHRPQQPDEGHEPGPGSHPGHRDGHPGGGHPGGGRAQAGNREQAGGRAGGRSAPALSQATVEDVRRTATGWRVGDEEVSDLTSAMVLADLLAAELPGPQDAGAQAPREPRPAAPAPQRSQEQPDVRQLQETVAQLEHALTVRVRVEQAIGVLAERHRLRPRQAFELLRSAARARGRRVLEIAGEVVDSATNPLLRIPEELARPPAPRRARLARRLHGYE